MGIKKSGELTHELEVSVPASRAWELYGTLKLAELAERSLSDTVSKVDVLEGDGGVGTVIQLTFAEGTPGPVTYFQEKFTKVDHANFLKETELVRGGYLDLGFAAVRVALHILHNPNKDDSCVIRSTIYYEYDPDTVSVANPDSVVSIDSLAAVALAAKDHLTSTI